MLFHFFLTESVMNSGIGYHLILLARDDLKIRDLLARDWGSHAVKKSRL